MKLVINGDIVDIPYDIKTVSDLLHHFQLHNKGAIVELNHSIIEKNYYNYTEITDGDKLEIVHFVGGG